MFLFLPKSICCGYLLEHTCSWRKKKKKKKKKNEEKKNKKQKKTKKNTQALFD